jgi:hypothetical protein
MISEFQLDACCPHETTWTPLLWASKLLNKAKEEKKVVFAT